MWYPPGVGAYIIYFLCVNGSHPYMKYCHWYVGDKFVSPQYLSFFRICIWQMFLSKVTNKCGTIQATVDQAETFQYKRHNTQFQILPDTSATGLQVREVNGMLRR